MLAEILLVLAGHASSLFPKDYNIDPAFVPLFHPGEKQCLESLGLIAWRYRSVKASCQKLSRSPSRYIRALSATLLRMLKEEYDTLVVQIESKVLQRDASLVAAGSFVPLSSIRVVFAEWDIPLASLVNLFSELEQQSKWDPGPLIDLLLAKSRTGVHKVAEIYNRLSNAVQAVWRTHLTEFIVHGTLNSSEPLATETFELMPGSMPSSVSAGSRESIVYIGKALATVKAAKWKKQIPQEFISEHTQLLETALPEDQHAFDRVIAQIRTNVSEWLWLNVLTHDDVQTAIDCLANYFLLRNGEFILSLIREIERLKISRLTARLGPLSMIREQDLQLAMLRASLGTTAQHDPALTQLRFSLPSGPLRPLLPSLANVTRNTTFQDTNELAAFDDLLLGTHLKLSLEVSWPLDIFLHNSDLESYTVLFSYLSSLRRTHVRIHGCWTSLSNAQRARRKWTGLGEGGTAEDLEARKGLLRCGWGLVRDMNWFLDTLLAYAMTDVVDVEYRKLKARLHDPKQLSASQSGHSGTLERKFYMQESNVVDFTTLRDMHTNYLERILTGCLLLYPTLTTTIREILELCERFAAQVERWGGDVLPALLFEGSIRGSGDEAVGTMVKERWGIVSEINESLHSLFEMFHEQLSFSASRQTLVDASKSVMMNASVMNASMYPVRPATRRKGVDRGGEVRRHAERLLLRLDFNGGFVKGRGGGDILKQGGL